MSEAISGVWRALTGFLWELSQCSYVTPSLTQPPPVRPPADVDVATRTGWESSWITGSPGQLPSKSASTASALGYVSSADVRQGDTIRITYHTSAGALPSSGVYAAFTTDGGLIASGGVIQFVTGQSEYIVTVPRDATTLNVNTSALADRQWGQLRVHIDRYRDQPEAHPVIATMDARRIAPGVVYASVTGIADPSLGPGGTQVYTIDLTIPLPAMPDTEQLPEEDPTEAIPSFIATMGQPMVWEHVQCLLAAVEPVIGRQPWQVDYYIIQSMGPDPVPVITTTIAIVAEGI